MKLFSSLIVTVFLAVLSVSASPVNAPGTAVRLRKRPGVKDATGVFNKDRALVERVTLQNKHRQNMINLFKNKGFLHKGFSIKPVAKIPAKVLARIAAGHKKRASEPLTEAENGVEWLGPISIGTPAQHFNIDFDTGSSDLWVSDSSCKSQACTGKKHYTPKKSSSSAKKNGTFTITYGDGSSVQGPIYQDTVRVAGLKVKQYFSSVTTSTSSLDGDPADGILGLAFPSISNLKHDPFFQSAVKQGAIKTKEFGFFLSSGISELFIGGVNRSLFQGDIEYHSIDSSNGFWQIPGVSAVLNNNTVLTNFSTIIDSGTTLTYGPPDAVKQIYDKIPGAQPWADQEGFYTLPCQSIPHFGFNFGGQQNFTMKTYFFNAGTINNSTTDCIGGLASADFGLGNTTWLVGDNFMRNFYTAFNLEKGVGFAQLS